MPLLARLGFDRLIAEAGYPGSEMVPALSAMLSLLALKLLDKERRSHIDDFNCDEAVGLFAGLNVPPKKIVRHRLLLPDRTRPATGPLAGMGQGPGPGDVPEPPKGSRSTSTRSPIRGDPAALDRHYLPRRGKAGPACSLSSRWSRSSRCLCYANANLTRIDQHGELMRFVEFWHEVAGSDPKWLYFDSKVVDYPELSRVNRRKIHFVTIRRRGTAILRRLEQQPASAWKGAVIDIPKRCHTHIRYIEEAVRLRGYEGPIRQIAVTGLGRDRPTLFLSNHFEETPRELIIRYAGRNRIEDGLGISVNFFHLDCLASEVRLNVDLDATLTVIANGCYRWLASRLNGFEKSDPKQLYRRFVETAGTVTIQNDRLIVGFRPPQPQPDPPRGRAGSRLGPDPVARPTEDRVHLPLTPTVVRELIIFPAAEIGVKGQR